ncbi:hypothetical protein BDZ94DRAFT_106988 [Collybia nuda]|uniref:DUF6533 domain-containing protein n=1 Tax=Collybia nuda TaxID=64659 RepID=A0A9P6CAF3_9AGAR|nr:hypothetical protein BDZ94DRAFT_106988 [Collybia nuda]
MFVDTQQVAREVLTHNYLRVFANSILFYDYIITIGREVEYIWRRPKSNSSYYFFLNRYNSLLGNVVIMGLSFTAFPRRLVLSHSTSHTGFDRTPHPHSCKPYNIIRQTLLVSNQLIICFLLSIRVYALYNCSRRIRFLMGCTGASLFVIALWLSFGQRSSQSGCYIGVSNETAIQYRMLLASRSASSYSGMLCGAFMKGGLSSFAADISSTMMSHLMLNLHEMDYVGIHTTIETTGLELDTLCSGALDQTFSITSPDPIADMGNETQETQEPQTVLPHTNS